MCVKPKLTQEEIEEIRKNPNGIDWHNIYYCKELSEDFIKEFKDKVVWGCISTNQRLSENFIREFQDKVLWKAISWFQNLSEDFIYEFYDKIDWNATTNICNPANMPNYVKLHIAINYRHKLKILIPKEI